MCKDVCVALLLLADYSTFCACSSKANTARPEKQHCHRWAPVQVTCHQVLVQGHVSVFLEMGAWNRAVRVGEGTSGQAVSRENCFLMIMNSVADQSLHLICKRE